MAHEQQHALGGADHDLSTLAAGFVKVVEDAQTHAKSLATEAGGTYELPPATTSSRGGIKVGAGLAVALDGLLSAALPTLTKTIITTSGTWTAPADGVVTIILVGGGGGGAPGLKDGTFYRSGGGGGGGGTTIYCAAVATGTAIPIGIGAGGAGGAVGSLTGASGNQSRIGPEDNPIAVAGGGSGATGTSPGSGGTGDIPGQAGSQGDRSTESTSPGSGGGNGGQGGTGVTSGAAGAKGGDGYAILFFAARPAAQ